MKYLSFLGGFIVGGALLGWTLPLSGEGTVPDNVTVDRALDQYATALVCDEMEYGLVLAGQITEYLGVRHDAGKNTKTGKKLREQVFQSIITGEWEGRVLSCQEINPEVLIDLMVITDIQRGERA